MIDEHQQVGFRANQAGLVARGRALLREAVLRQLGRTRLQGFVTAEQLADLLDWEQPVPSELGTDALLWILEDLFTRGLVEPAHPDAAPGARGGWRMALDEYRRSHVAAHDSHLPRHPDGEWLSLIQCPRPTKDSPYANPPALLRMPDGIEYEPRTWRRVLALVVEWLNTVGLLTPRVNVPMFMVHGSRYLVNTAPRHSDASPMMITERAGGPDRLWVNCKNSSSYGWHSLNHSIRLIRACGVAPEDVQLYFTRHGALELSALRRSLDRPQPTREPLVHQTTDAGVKRLLWITITVDGGLEIWEAVGRP